MHNNEASIKPAYLQIVSHYEDCFKEFGANHKGVDWPNEVDANTRLEVMLDLIQYDHGKPIKLLDLGCGYGAMFEYINSKNLAAKIDYYGVDLSSEMIAYAKNNLSASKFDERDILAHPFAENSFDYTIMNGVFTEKLSISQQEMLDFLVTMLKETARISKKGFAFNVMSKHVDYEKEFLFHVSYDEIAKILKDELNIRNRHIFRADYGLYEFTTYVYNI